VAKTPLFAAGSAANVRKMAPEPPPTQAAKTPLFAAGNAANVRKMAAGHFSNKQV
jgi:hypothetical protein